jgi:hypothetical protein
MDNSTTKNNQVTYEQRVRDSFASVVALQERIGKQSPSLLESLFTLHPDVLLKGVAVRYDTTSHTWRAISPNEGVLCETEDAASLARVLSRNTD